MLVPLGLLAWAAFSIPLVMVNYTHIISSLSDPFGWGWNLFGTAQSQWRPLLPEAVGSIQIPLLLAGLAVALRRGDDILRDLYPQPRRAARALVPLGGLCTLMTLLLLRLFVG